MAKNQKLIDIAQKMHDTIGANLSAAKMFYSASENYMIEATKEDREAFKRANSLIDESCELLREIYEDLNNL